MIQDLKIILIIIITLALMFATSLLLDLQIVQDQTVRKAIVYLTIATQVFFGFKIVKFEIKTQNGKIFSSNRKR